MRTMSSPLRWLKAIALPMIGLLALEWWARGPGKDSDALAAPSKALKAFIGAATDGSLWSGTGFTLFSAATGLFIATALALIIGTALGLSKRLNDASFLTIEVLRPIPSVALVPLAMLIYGFGFRMEIGVIAFACFWPMLILIQTAVRQIDPCLLEVSAALELSNKDRFFKIIAPSIIPRVFVALRLGIAIALVVAVTVEIAANPHGMGYAIIYAQQSLDPALMLAWLLWISLVGFLVNLVAVNVQSRVAQRMGQI